MKKALIIGLLSATCFITTSAIAAVQVSVSHTEVPSKAPEFTNQLKNRYQLPPQYVDIKQQRLAKDIGNQVISTSKSALMPGKNWYGIKQRRVNPFLEQYPEVDELVVSYMYRQGITNFLDVKNFVTVQEAVDDELAYDFLEQLWSINDMKGFITDEDHPFVKYHKSRMNESDYRLFEQALNSIPAQDNGVISIRALVVHGMVMQDFYRRGVVSINMNGAN